MSTEKEDIVLEDDFVAEEEDSPAAQPEVSPKAVLAKRRVIDNLLEERRLQKQLSDYDFDL